MIVEKLADRIIIKDPTDFDVRQTLDCGQIFRYRLTDTDADVYSIDKYAHINISNKAIEIITKDVDYFYNFFDFDNDYSYIKNELRKDSFLCKAVDYGYGIRILNNDPFEMMVSFIISANNNIPRIKNSIEYLCTNFGEDKGGYFAFPTLEQLKSATVEDYVKAGLGYRAPQLYDTIQKLENDDIKEMSTLSLQEKAEKLISFKGIGEKVANCVLLFGFHEMRVFPVDTWINKVYNTLTNSNETNRRKITKIFTDRYKDLSGYAQQYFFYYFRDNKF